MTARCLFCGGDASEPNHFARCDGRQGRLEAEALYGHQGDVPFEAQSPTSAAAAGSIDADDLNRLEAVVFAVLHARPRTCDAVEQETGLSHQTASARIRGLVLRDQIVDSGVKAPTRSGRLAVVWKTRAS